MAVVRSVDPSEATMISRRSRGYSRFRLLRIFSRITSASLYAEMINETRGRRPGLRLARARRSDPSRNSRMG
jgi:hypothetical protein